MTPAEKFLRCKPIKRQSELEMILFELTLDEIREKGINQMPHTLRGSLEALIRDNDYLLPSMTKAFLTLSQNAL